MSVNDPLQKMRPGFNNKSGIAIWSTAGRSQINEKSFTELIRVMRPDVVQSLCDSDTSRNSFKKRISNSVSRTLDFLTAFKNDKETDGLRDIAVLGSIEGGYDGKSRHYSVEETKKHRVDGYVIEGFHSFGYPSDLVLDEETKNLMESTIALLPSDSPRMIWGAFSPDVMLELFKMGIDVVDSSFATGLTEEGKALLISDSQNDSAYSMSTTILDMNSNAFREDFEPLSTSCSCYCCKKRISRSYLYHLLNTKEMLSSVLLNLHNLQVLQDFVNSIQKYYGIVYRNRSNQT
jgi:tRNA-guanine family transglycosylase